MELRIFQKGFNYSQDGPGNRLVYHLQGCNLHCPWCANPEGLPLRGGVDYTIAALVDEVISSKMMFFDGGGVTLTGGEVTVQPEEVREFLSELHRLGIHTCIETNGGSDCLEALFPLVDYLIMDIKHYDSDIHKAVIGKSFIIRTLPVHAVGGNLNARQNDLTVAVGDQIGHLMQNGIGTLGNDRTARAGNGAVGTAVLASVLDLDVCACTLKTCMRK